MMNPCCTMDVSEMKRAKLPSKESSKFASGTMPFLIRNGT